MIDTSTKNNKVWYQSFLEKYNQSKEEYELSEVTPIDEYQKLKHEHRQKVAAFLLKEKDE